MITDEQHLENMKRLQSIINDIHNNNENKNIAFNKLLELSYELASLCEKSIAIIKEQAKKIQEFNELLGKTE